jgi:polar amino acid transport system substrate-binding protein
MGPVTVACLVVVLLAACTSAPPPSASAPASGSPATLGSTESPNGAPASQAATPTPTPAPSPSASESPAALESELSEPGVLNVCLAIVGAQAAAVDSEGELVGYNVAFAREIAARLSLEPSFQQPLFEEVIDLVADHECDISVSSQNITTSRLERMSMIPYTKSQQPVLVEIGNPHNIDSLQSLCGLSVSVTAGTTHADLVQGRGDYADAGLNDDCREAGRATIDLQTYPTEAEAVGALLDGEVAAYLGNSGFIVDYEDDIAYAQTTLPPARQGIGVATDHPVLFAAVESALTTMIADGTYRQILTEHLPNAESVDIVSIED